MKQIRYPRQCRGRVVKLDDLGGVIYVLYEKRSYTFYHNQVRVDNRRPLKLGDFVKFNIGQRPNGKTYVFNVRLLLFTIPTLKSLRVSKVEVEELFIGAVTDWNGRKGFVVCPEMDEQQNTFLFFTRLLEPGVSNGDYLLFHPVKSRDERSKLFVNYAWKLPNAPVEILAQYIELRADEFYANRQLINILKVCGLERYLPPQPESAPDPSAINDDKNEEENIVDEFEFDANASQDDDTSVDDDHKTALMIDGWLERGEDIPIDVQMKYFHYASPDQRKYILVKRSEYEVKRIAITYYNEKVVTGNCMLEEVYGFVEFLYNTNWDDQDLLLSMRQQAFQILQTRNSSKLEMLRFWSQGFLNGVETTRYWKSLLSMQPRRHLIECCIYCVEKNTIGSEQWKCLAEVMFDSLSNASVSNRFIQIYWILKGKFEGFKRDISNDFVNEYDLVAELNKAQDTQFKIRAVAFTGLAVDVYESEVQLNIADLPALFYFVGAKKFSQTFETKVIELLSKTSSSEVVDSIVQFNWPDPALLIDFLKRIQKNSALLEEIEFIAILNEVYKVYSQNNPLFGLFIELYFAHTLFIDLEAYHIPEDLEESVTRYEKKVFNNEREHAHVDTLQADYLSDLVPFLYSRQEEKHSVYVGTLNSMFFKGSIIQFKLESQSQLFTVSIPEAIKDIGNSTLNKFRHDPDLSAIECFVYRNNSANDKYSIKMDALINRFIQVQKARADGYNSIGSAVRVHHGNTKSLPNTDLADKVIRYLIDLSGSREKKPDYFIEPIYVSRKRYSADEKISMQTFSSVFFLRANDKCFGVWESVDHGAASASYIFVCQQEQINLLRSRLDKAIKLCSDLRSRLRKKAFNKFNLKDREAKANQGVLIAHLGFLGILTKSRTKEDQFESWKERLHSHMERTTQVKTLSEGSGVEFGYPIPKPPKKRGVVPSSSASINDIEGEGHQDDDDLGQDSEKDPNNEFDNLSDNINPENLITPQEKEIISTISSLNDLLKQVLNK